MNTMRCLQGMNAFMNSLQNQDFCLARALIIWILEIDHQLYPNAIRLVRMPISSWFNDLAQGI